MIDSRPVSSRRLLLAIDFTSHSGDGGVITSPCPHFLIKEEGSGRVTDTVNGQLVAIQPARVRRGRRTGGITVVYSVSVLRKWAGLGRCRAACVTREGIQNGMETMAPRRDGEGNAASRSKKPSVLDREVTKYLSASRGLCKADNQTPRSGFLPVSSFCIYPVIHFWA